VHQSHCELTVVTSILMMRETLAWLHFPKKIIKHFKKARNQKNKSIHMRDVKYHFVSSVCYNDPALSPDVLKHWPLEREAFRPRGVRVSVHQIHSKSSWYIACIIVDMDDWKTLMWVTPIGHTLSFIITLTYHDAIQESSESSNQCCILNDMSTGENRVWPYHSIISRNTCFIHW